MKYKKNKMATAKKQAKQKKQVAVNKKPLEQKLYGLVMYNISSKQQGIQFGHANDEYKLKYGKDKNYQEFLKKHKTYIMLSGGTSNDGTKSHYGYPKQLGTMEQHLDILRAHKIKCAPFYEPDLNYALSAIVFLVDERVFNKVDYPDFEYTKSDHNTLASYNSGLDDDLSDYEHEKAKRYKQYVKKVGKDVAFLKIFLKQFKLA